MTADSNNVSDENQAPDNNAGANLTFWQVLGSTLAAAFGVQSSKNRKRDFTHGKASHFIFMGIGFTVAFVLVMIGVVNLVLP